MNTAHTEEFIWSKSQKTLFNKYYKYYIKHSCDHIGNVKNIVCCPTVSQSKNCRQIILKCCQLIAKDYIDF